MDDPDAQVPSDVITKRIRARVDNTLGCSEQYTEGTIRIGGLRTAFTIAGLNSSSVFLDVGFWYGGPMQLAKEEFGVRMALGIEVCRDRVTQALLHAKTTKVPLFPVHLSAECFEYYDPATHVFVFGTAMGNLALAAIQCAIARSRSVRYVVTEKRCICEMDLPGYRSTLERVKYNKYGFRYKIYDAKGH